MLNEVSQGTKQLHCFVHPLINIDQLSNRYKTKYRKRYDKNLRKERTCDEENAKTLNIEGCLNDQFSYMIEFIGFVFKMDIMLLNTYTTNLVVIFYSFCSKLVIIGQ